MHENPVTQELVSNFEYDWFLIGKSIILLVAAVFSGVLSIIEKSRKSRNSNLQKVTPSNHSHSPSSLCDRSNEKFEKIEPLENSKLETNLDKNAYSEAADDSHITNQAMEKLLVVLNSKKSEMDSMRKDIDKAYGYEDKIWKDDVLNVDIVSDDFVKVKDTGDLTTEKEGSNESQTKTAKKGRKEEDRKSSDSDNKRLLDVESSISSKGDAE